MKAQREERANEECTPPGEARGFAFGVGFVHAVAMVVEMRRLDGMHAGEHEDAQGEEGPILDGAGPTEAVVLCAVGEAQAGEEEIEGGECAEEEVMMGVEVNGSGEPGKGQGELENALPFCDGDEVAPWDGVEVRLRYVATAEFMMHRERAHGIIEPHDSHFCQDRN